ncbi:uncharacterized protein LOC143836528 [Paroedura picta]|uniref:uncharacterized protein LOC143836528 n=1 Tax=Paroedura picta TaxID=143630 RepID=UPI004057259D
MARMISATSFLLLLFLPPKSCLPLEWPWPAPPRITPLGGSKWEAGPSPHQWEDEPSRPPSSPTDHQLLSQRPQQSCKPPEVHTPLPWQQRSRRSAPSSKRREGRPNSLDLTFHLLREFLEMSREERLAQKARSNRILLQNIGK